MQSESQEDGDSGLGSTLPELVGPLDDREANAQGGAATPEAPPVPQQPIPPPIDTTQPTMALHQQYPPNLLAPNPLAMMPHPAAFMYNQFLPQQQPFTATPSQPPPLDVAPPPTEALGEGMANGSSVELQTDASVPPARVSFPSNEGDDGIQDSSSTLLDGYDSNLGSEPNQVMEALEPTALPEGWQPTLTGNAETSPPVANGTPQQNTNHNMPIPGQLPYYQQPFMGSIPAPSINPLLGASANQQMAMMTAMMMNNPFGMAGMPPPMPAGQVPPGSTSFAQAMHMDNLLRSQIAYLASHSGPFQPGPLAAGLMAQTAPARASLSTGTASPGLALAQLPARKRPAKNPPSKDKPKRPLTGYNIFFKEERLRIYAERGVDVEETKKDEQEEDLARIQHTSTRTKKKRREEQPGVIEFEELGKLVGQRWKNLSEEERANYNKLAKKAMPGYKEQVRERNKRTREELLNLKPKAKPKEDDESPPSST